MRSSVPQQYITRQSLLHIIAPCQQYNENYLNKTRAFLNERKHVVESRF